MSASTSLVSGVDFIAVPTKDFEAAYKFYDEVLGLEFAKRWGDLPAAEFETGTLTIAVMQSDAFKLDFAPHTHPIALHVDDVEAARAELEGEGNRVRSRHAGQRRLPHGVLRRSRRQRADAPQPLRAPGGGARRLKSRRPPG